MNRICIFRFAGKMNELLAVLDLLAKMENINRK